MFSFKTFVVSHLTFQSLIYFEFISVYGVKERKKESEVTHLCQDMF